MTSIFDEMTLSSKFFWLYCVFIVMFSYWSKFHVSIMIGSGFITTFVHKELTWNLEMRNTHVCVLPNIWRLRIIITVSNKMLLNATDCQGCSFYHFWVIKGNLTGDKITPLLPPRLGLNEKLSNWQLNKLKSGKKNGAEVTLKHSSKVVDDSNDENNFPHKLLLTNSQVSKLRKTFVSNSSANRK